MLKKVSLSCKSSTQLCQVLLSHQFYVSSHICLETTKDSFYLHVKEKMSQVNDLIPTASLLPWNSSTPIMAKKQEPCASYVCIRSLAGRPRLIHSQHDENAVGHQEACPVLLSHAKHINWNGIQKKKWCILNEFHKFMMTKRYFCICSVIGANPQLNLTWKGSHIWLQAVQALVQCHDHSQTQLTTNKTSTKSKWCCDTRKTWAAAF